ncbi:Rv1733c family protein [Kitasatospora purpeofusca]|uniref:Rv1733c family protein n=1 Tax=Kitasatospora purpeofusca TaxID=67352 RepID=UPI00381FB785
MTAQQRPAAHTPLGTQVRRASGLDHNPLCRPVDRARSRTALALPLVLALLIAVGAVVAVLAFRVETHAEQGTARHRHAVVATTVGPAVTDDLRTGGSPAHAPARWAYPVGPGSGTVQVAVGTPVGSAVAIHLDDSGVPAPGARTTAAALSDAGVLGVGTATGLVSLALVGYMVHRRTLDRRAERSWEPDWERVEPLWSQRR